MMQPQDRPEPCDRCGKTSKHSTPLPSGEVWHLCQHHFSEAADALLDLLLVKS